MTLRTRVKQVSGVIGSCHAALCNVYGAMLPLNQQPDGLFALIKQFFNYDRVKTLVRRQLIAGGKVALAVAKTHHPRMDLRKLAEGPRISTGRQRVSMPQLYREATPAAVALMEMAEKESEAELSRGYTPPPF